MDRKTFRNIITLISFAALLFLLVLRLDGVLGILSRILHILKPIFAGFAIAFILTRPCNFFSRLYARALPRARTGVVTGMAVLTSYFCLFAVVTLIFTMVIPQLYESVRSLAAGIYANLPSMQTALNSLLAQLNLDSAALSGMLPPLNQIVDGAINAMSSALPHLLSFTGSLFSSSVSLITALVLSVYMLAGRSRLTNQSARVLRAYLAPTAAHNVEQVSRLIADTFTRFISGQLLEAVILGALCFVGMLVLRLSYAPLISVIIAVCALIPVAGAYIGAIVSALLLVMISPPQALGFLIFIVVLQQIEGNLIYPRVVGSSIGLPGLWVLIAVLVGGGLFGLLGMLISVPAASVCYTLLRQDVDARSK